MKPQLTIIFTFVALSAVFLFYGSNQTATFTWKTLNKPVETVGSPKTVIAFTAGWCLISGPLYRKQLHDPAVIQYLNSRGSVGVIADCTETNSPGRDAMHQHNVQSIPSIGVWRNGKLVTVIPELSPEGIIAALETLRVESLP